MPHTFHSSWSASNAHIWTNSGNFKDRNFSILRKQNTLTEMAVWDVHLFPQLTQRLRFPRTWHYNLVRTWLPSYWGTHSLHLHPKDALGNVRKHISEQAVPHSENSESWTQYLNTRASTTILLESRWNVMPHGDARERKWRGNWRMEWVASTLHTTSEHGVSSITTADAHTSTSSSRLNWRPRRFKWTRPFRRKTISGFCACAITFQTQSTKHEF